MDVNKYKIAFRNRDEEVNLPFISNWEVNGIDDGYFLFETEAIKRVINPEIDFEVSRFSHEPYFGLTKIFYNFNFRNPSIPEYIDSYVSSGLFTIDECYYNSNSFSKSFFKLDLYDSSGSTEQKNYISIILPTQQGLTEDFSFGLLPLVSVRKPQFALDFIGDKEGFFIYWLKYRDYLNVDTFYMSAKFFDAKRGEFIRMINQEQQTNTINSDSFFYYKVELNYTGQTYQIINTNTFDRVGTSITNPIKWFQYINP